MTDQSSGFIVAVVDDDQRILESLENLLESADYAVRAFASATALLESGCIEHVGCLISDISMPVMDGFDLVRQVRALRAGLPIILITGQFDTLDRLQAMGPGRYRVFRKPFDGQELLTAVADALAT